MAKYFGKRLVIGLITLFALATITFFLMHAIPGSSICLEKRSKLPANSKGKVKLSSMVLISLLQSSMYAICKMQ